MILIFLTYDGKKVWNTLTSPVYGYELSALFVETIDFEQLVDLPTRGNHILDLVISTHPDMVSQVGVVPGISDHEVIANCSN